MSAKTPAQIFNKKAKEFESDLGAAVSGVTYDAQKNRFYQLFERGVILGLMKKGSTMDEKLICVHGKLFHAWWNFKESEWLGNPLEDLFRKNNREGQEIMVQRFENGVIYCRSDGVGDVQWLSWHDWHVISHPTDVSGKHP